MGFTYNITISANLISIGCKDFTPDEIDKAHEELPEHEQSCVKSIIDACLADILSKDAK